MMELMCEGFFFFHISNVIVGVVRLREATVTDTWTLFGECKCVGASVYLSLSDSVENQQRYTRVLTSERQGNVRTDTFE